MGKQGKIPVATLLGLYASGKTVWDFKKYLDATALEGEARTNAWFWKITGYGLADGSFDISQPIGTFGPAIVGKMVSKYVGGKDKNGNGLNINAQLRAIPLFKV